MGSTMRRVFKLNVKELTYLSEATASSDKAEDIVTGYKNGIICKKQQRTLLL